MREDWGAWESRISVSLKKLLDCSDICLWLEDWVNLSKRGGKDGVFRGLAGLLTEQCSEGFPEGNPEEPPCQPMENLALSDSFTQIYILFLIGFRIGPTKMHRRFRIGLPKINRRFHIGPTKMHISRYILPCKSWDQYRQILDVCSVKWYIFKM